MGLCRLSLSGFSSTGQSQAIHTLFTPPRTPALLGCLFALLRAGVGGQAVRRLGDAYRMDSGTRGEGVIEFGSELVGDVLGEMFGGGVELIEGRDVVEVGIREGLADLGEGVFDQVKIAQESLGIEL